jgi:hypothetical protein
MIISIKNDDRVYENWCKTNPEGFVLNRASLTNNKIHLASCSHLNRSNGQGLQTFNIPKVCSWQLSELIEEARLLCGEEWNMCLMCKKKIEGNNQNSKLVQQR